MKEFILITAALLATSQCGKGQVPLSPGDSYTYDFSSLPFLNSLSPVPAGTPNSFSASFALDGTSIDPGDSFLFELGISGAIPSSILWQGPGSPQNLSLAGPFFGGFVRFTGVSGSVTIDSIRMDSYLHAGTFVPTLNHYGATITSVPEPKVFLLAALASVSLWFTRRRH